jgi:hypothetical protein
MPFTFDPSQPRNDRNTAQEKGNEFLRIHKKPGSRNLKKQEGDGVARRK